MHYGGQLLSACRVRAANDVRWHFGELWFEMLR